MWIILSFQESVPGLQQRLHFRVPGSGPVMGFCGKGLNKGFMLGFRVRVSGEGFRFVFGLGWQEWVGLGVGGAVLVEHCPIWLGFQAKGVFVLGFGWLGLAGGGTSLVRKRSSVGPCSSPMPRALWWS